MRTVLLLLITALPLASGCTSVAPRDGTDLLSGYTSVAFKVGTDLLSDLTTREQVHARFGTPIATGIVNGHEYEEFREPVEISPVTLSGNGLVRDATLRLVYDQTGRVMSRSTAVHKDARQATVEDLHRYSANIQR
jgi:hypothetical protein